MGIKEITYKAESLDHRLAEFSGLLLAVNEAIFRGGFAAGEYENAMSLLVRMAFDLSKDANETSENLYAFMRTEQKGKTP